ncbi:MAG TPA: DUF2520 domain-containing protein, partial [Cytophagaceae bacterium]|nr:DUF2520 domain-containing protein [Cytophagaceae bacterium]
TQDHLDFSDSNSNVFIFAIRDQALEEVIDKTKVPEKAVVIHTSGSMPMEVLKKFQHHGVFYTIQTFTKGKYTNLSEVPIGIEASDDDTNQKLFLLAASISKQAQSINSEQRKVIHLAAIVACNFTNHLYAISEGILKNENLNLTLLKPLMYETLQKSLEIGPQRAQTGPAIRGDEKIIQQHLDYLANEPEIQQLYKLLSEHIKKMMP